MTNSSPVRWRLHPFSVFDFTSTRRTSVSSIIQFHSVCASCFFNFRLIILFSLGLPHLSLPAGPLVMLLLLRLHFSFSSTPFSLHFHFLFPPSNSSSSFPLFPPTLICKASCSDSSNRIWKRRARGSKGERPSPEFLPTLRSKAMETEVKENIHHRRSRIGTLTSNRCRPTWPSVSGAAKRGFTASEQFVGIINKLPPRVVTNNA